MRTPLIVGNWKMNKTASEGRAFVRDFQQLVEPSTDVEVVLAPPFTALESVRSSLGATSRIMLGAQNLHWEQQGAFTGEISGSMLLDLGCRYVIVGHSERRTLFWERNEDVQKKVRAALACGLRPILCVGESLTERETGQTERIIDEQLSAGLDQLTDANLKTVTIAYEPVWAIGTGRAATTVQAGDVHRSIRAFVANRWKDAAAATMRILYGGSVTAQNAASFLESPDIDGALVGGACLNPDSFAKIIAAANRNPHS
ncbi:Triosephosphate isomerase [Nitrospira japonica]|uniref:Triosephosphate isomerase n=1 Tax=Nitrospira japonica TaxID=1325564 RepID=A0A1W1I5N2_9BACT|nr:triose-phosphate isomerase [Nitrospira japonica]SLM48285.1 Triosephosphate isomerase [Nitrospira japonica]